MDDKTYNQNELHRRITAIPRYAQNRYGQDGVITLAIRKLREAGSNINDDSIIEWVTRHAREKDEQEAEAKRRRAERKAKTKRDKVMAEYRRLRSVDPLAAEKFLHDADPREAARVALEDLYGKKI